MGKFLVFLGFVLIVVGVIWEVGGKHLPLGRLPGDILIDKGKTRFYFPLMSSIVVSLILSAILYLIKKFKG